MSHLLSMQKNSRDNCSERLVSMYQKNPKKRLLLLAITSVTVGLAGCGGGDDYQAQSCLGQPNSANDCRHFDQNQTDATQGNNGTGNGNDTGNGAGETTGGGETPPNPQNPDTSNPDNGTDTNNGIWKDFVYDNAQVSALTANPASSFEKHHKDEVFNDLAIVGNNAVVASHYHNRLRRFVLNSGVATLQQGLDYATAPGDRYQVDALSGATEQLLSDIDIQASDTGLIVTGEVDSYNDNTNTGVGVYVNRADASGNFTDVRFASPDSTQYHALADISAQSLSTDGKQIAVSNKSGEVSLLDATTLNSQHTAKVDFTVHSLAFSADGQWLYVGGKKKVGLFGGEGVIAVFNTQSFTETGRMTSSNEVDITKLWALDNQQVIAQAATSPYLLMLQWNPSGTQIDKQRQINMPVSIRSVAVTKQQDKNYLAIADSRNNLNVISLSTGKRSELKYTDNINGLAFDDQGYVWILSSNHLSSVPYSF